MSATGTRLAAHGLAVHLPRGWDGRIYRRAADVPLARTHPVLHAASFPLPPEVGDYGSGAVDVMGPASLFFSLLEFDPSSTRTALFARQGMRLPLDPDLFSPWQLQRTFGGQSGLQRFYSAAGRAFCLYVVLGAHERRHELVPMVNDTLATVGADPLGPS